MTDVNALKKEIAENIEAATDLRSLEEVRVTVLGKKGRITALMKTLGQMDPEERKQKGQALNRLKDDIAALISTQEATLKKQEMDARLVNETIDITLPVDYAPAGSIHPINQTISEFIDIFCSICFKVAEGPDI